VAEPQEVEPSNDLGRLALGGGCPNGFYFVSLCGRSAGGELPGRQGRRPALAPATLLVRHLQCVLKPWPLNVNDAQYCVGMSGLCLAYCLGINEAQFRLW
jgi:hypothetical protein